MFKVGNYKIYFYRRNRLVYIASIKSHVNRDCVHCYIKDMTTDKTISCGMAVLNPIDRYDKIVGKKIALTKALNVGDIFDKLTRTNIWRDFWFWVADWKSNVYEINKDEK